ncbi:MAG: DNA repair protein RecN [Bauldia sp.]|nr:DNA repair protein RecN [Bauldia sp.]
MLSALAIRDIVLIETLDLVFERGLTVLTGETGAGKSILLDALSLALGARGDGALVRHGAEQGQVTAVFEPPADHPAFGLLRDNGLSSEGEMILRRWQGRDGRSRAYINDQPVGVALLRQVGATLIEIHGQHDDRALVEAEAHRRLVDAFGGLAADVADVGARHRAWRDAEAALDGHRRRIAAAQAEADYLRAALDELTQLGAKAGEEDALAELRHRLMRNEKVSEDVADALEAVAGGGSPVPSLASLARRLERRRDVAGDLLTPAVAAIDRALAALEDARAALETAQREAAYDPRQLERTEQRLFALRGAARKFDTAVDMLPELATRIAADLDTLESGEAKLGAMVKEAKAARTAYDAAAAALSQARRKAADQLERAVAAELPALKLEAAAFTVEMISAPDEPGESGVDRVSFVVRTNPGSRPGPLAKVASGGELSRFLLAIKVALADRGSAPTLIFDEVDTAVGGAVSDAIGLRLSRLAETVQVLSVTHAPQVAARADRHLSIAKEPHAVEDRVVTRVVALDSGRRREEIARMLAGSVITAEARAAADRLLDGAVKRRVREPQ